MLTFQTKNIYLPLFSALDEGALLSSSGLLPKYSFSFFFFFEWKTNISFHQFSPECGALGTKFPCLLLLSIVSMLESHLPFKTNSNYASIKSEPFL